MKDDISIETSLNHLVELFAGAGRPGDGIANTCRILAKELSNQLHPRPSWGWQYIHQVLHKKITPSRRLMSAIERLHYKKTPPSQTNLQSVSILAPIGYLQPDTLLTIPARLCARPSCTRTFIPTNPNHRFCSATCRKLSKKTESRKNES